MKAIYLILCFELLGLSVLAQTTQEKFPRNIQIDDEFLQNKTYSHSQTLIDKTKITNLKSTSGQDTVSIPGPNFEQALIDLGIDSDKTLNQQILSGDAASPVRADLQSVCNSNTFSMPVPICNQYPVKNRTKAFAKPDSNK